MSARQRGAPGRPLAALLAGLLLLLAGCTSDTGHSAVDSALQSRFTPIVIAIGKNRAAKMSGGTGVAVLVGSYALQSWREESIKKSTSTFIVLRHVVGGKKKVTVFRFDSRHRIHVAMNGRFEQDIVQNVITITPDPKVNSRIVVTDATTGDTVLTTGSFNTTLGVIKGYQGIDFDTGDEIKRGKDGSGVDLGYMNADWINGSAVASWPKDKEPSLAGCSSLPADAWDDGLSLVLKGTHCIRTNAGHIGFMQLSTGLPAKMRYVIWKDTVT